MSLQNCLSYTNPNLLLTRQIPHPASFPLTQASSACTDLVLSPGSLLGASSRKCGETKKSSAVSMSGGGSVPASLEFPSAEWRRVYDRLQGLLPRVEALAADRARLEAASNAQRELSESREKRLHARLLQVEASRERWKAAYTELPPGANPKLAELQERDLVDSQTSEALPDVNNSQLKENSEDTYEMHLEQCMMDIFVEIHASNFRKKERSTV